jgi:2'-5' RNA ligase
VAATASVGRAPEGRPFRGHVTVARLKGLTRAAARRLGGAAVSASWSVEEIALVRSRLGSDRARYEVVAVRALQ